MNDLTKSLKMELWNRFGKKEYPSEWDGFNYGGGKLSQRFWEYFKAIELLGLTKESIVLDIGGGSPKTGMGFFAMLVSRYVKKIIILDQNLNEERLVNCPANVEFLKEYACYQNLKTILENNPDISHIVSISVLEHIPIPLREEIIKAINVFFRGDIFVATMEYHSKRCYFEYQLTAKTISELFEAFTHFYLERFCSTPVWSQDAFVGNRIESNKIINCKFLKDRIQKFVYALGGKEIPGWYPVVVKFSRSNS